MDTIGIVGLGVVGRAVANGFDLAGLNVTRYDRYLGIGSPSDLRPCSVVFLCVPTPSAPDGRHDLTEVWSAVREVEAHLDDGTVLAVKSTVPPGTSASLSAAFPRLRFASVPEFLVAARALDSFTRPDRVVVGTTSPEAAAALGEIMARVAPGSPVVHVTPLEAELVKLCSNALLAAKVSMANELAEICERVGVPWPRVKAVVGLDRRIGPDHLAISEERGFGGECLPKDLDGLIAASRDLGHEATLLAAIADFNRRIRGEAPRAAEPQPVGSRRNGRRASS